MLHIVLPDTLIPVPAGRNLPDGERASFAPPPALNRLMARGRWSGLAVCDGDPLEQWLFATLFPDSSAAFGPAAEAPTAGRGTRAGAGQPAGATVPPWAMLGARDVPAFSRWWVSPVHVQIGREGVSLLPPDALALSGDEAEQLNSTVQAVLREAGWLPAADTQPGDGSAGVSEHPPAQWGCLMQAPAPLPQALPSPWALARTRFTDLLPAGPAMAAWRRLWMDVQMALHAHPVNAARQARGLPTVNAYWWWGGGDALPSEGLPTVNLQVSDLASGRLEPSPLTLLSPHRCAAWLSALLPREGGSDKAPSAGGNALSVHLLENASAGVFFRSGAAHPLVQAIDSNLIAPLTHAAVPHELVLLGQSAWRSVSSSASLRLAIWKNRARVDDLLEPVTGLLDEGDLARAWQESARRATPDDGEFHPERF